MGYEVSQFSEEVSEELICSICNEILKEPMTTECEHLYCRECISDWLRENRTCPVDRVYIHLRNLKPAPRVIRNLLSKLMIHCDFTSLGCQKVVPLENLHLHLNDCYFNPKRLLKCQIGCDQMMTREQLQSHNCWKDIRRDLDVQVKISEHLIRQRNILICLILLLFIYIFYPSFFLKFCSENILIFTHNYDDDYQSSNQ